MRFKILDNGTLITDEMAAFLASTRSCDGIQVSIDGSVPITHDSCRGRGTFRKAMNGIKNLQKYKLPVTVRVTIHRSNVHHLENVARLLLEEIGPAGVFHQFCLSSGALPQTREMVQLTVEERVLAMETLLRLTAKYDGRINAAGPLAEGRAWLEMEQTRRDGTEMPGRGYLTGCGGAMTTIGVRADGAMVACCQMPHMELGRINRDNLLEVWQHHPGNLTGSGNVRPYPLPTSSFARGRDYVSYCTGNCPALSYTLTGSAYQPSPDACLRRFLEQGGRLPREQHPEQCATERPL